MHLPSPTSPPCYPTLVKLLPLSSPLPHLESGHTNARVMGWSCTEGGTGEHRFWHMVYFFYLFSLQLRNILNLMRTKRDMFYQHCKTAAHEMPAGDDRSVRLFLPDNPQKGVLEL